MDQSHVSYYYGVLAISLRETITNKKREKNTILNSDAYGKLNFDTSSARAILSKIASELVNEMIEHRNIMLMNCSFRHIMLLFAKKKIKQQQKVFIN